MLKDLKDLKNLREDIKIWYDNLFIFDWYYYIKNTIINYWKYKKVIAIDRWYDYQFIMNLIEFKLEDTIKNWDKAHYIGSNFTKGRMIIILKRIKTFQDNLYELQEKYYSKTITKEKYLKEKNILLEKTWKSFGRNITRFWD